MYVTMQLLIIITSLPSNRPSAAHGIRSDTASMQHFSYQTLVNLADFTVFKSYASIKNRFPIFLCMLSSAYSLLYHGGSLYTSYLGGSASFLRLLGIPTLAILIYSTRSGLLSIYVTVLPRTLTTTHSMPCIISASHVHAPSLPQGPTCPPLGHTLLSQ